MNRYGSSMALINITYYICPNGCNEFTVSGFTSTNPYDTKGISSVTNGTFSGMTVTVTDNTQDVVVVLHTASIGATEGYVQEGSPIGKIVSWN